MTYGQLASWLIGQLEPIYDSREARSIQRYLFTALLNLTSAEWLIRKDEEAGIDFESVVKAAVLQLKEHEPVQYVIGKSWFCEFEFYVNPDVLIPRPETEELVYKIVNDYKSSGTKTVIDIGTGSGAIAIALAKLLPQFSVSALDISANALNVAKKNAGFHQVDVHFHEVDILLYNKVYNSPFSHTQFDVIVSNPPYVKDSEKIQMVDNVLKFEPHSALFVSDEDPLVFYRAIINFSRLHLADQGYIYLEINESEGNNLQGLLHEYGFSTVEILKDLNDKDRFIKASK